MILDGFFEKLAENLLDLMPWYVVRSYEMACQWTFGQNPIPKGPGWHWRWYGITTYEKMPVVDDVLELPVQTVISKDKKSISFKAVVRYRIEDVVLHFCNVNEFIPSTKALAMGHLAKRVRDQSLEETELDLDKLERSCAGTLTTQVKEWGTKILGVHFVDFAEVPTHVRLWGDNSNSRITTDV